MPVWGSSSPSTRLELYANIPFDRNYHNVIRFTSRDQQLGYFESHLTGYATGSFEDGAKILGQTGTILFANYLNPNGEITPHNTRMTVKVNAVAEQLYLCNYIGWTNNPDTSNLNPDQWDYDEHCPEQWYFAFVTNIYHIANNVSVIEFELDYWQTYHLRITPLQCFVERESPESDEPFENLEPEELEPSIYKISSNTTYTPSTMSTPCVVIEGVPTEDQGIGDNSGFYGFVYNGANIYTYPIISNWQSIETSIKEFINSFQNSGGTINRIYMCYGVPEKTTNMPANEPTVFDTGIQKTVTTLDGYKFRNNKLNNYPYRRITLLLPDKTKITVLPQLVNSQSVQILVSTIMGNPPTIIVSPANYDSVKEHFAFPYIMSFSQTTECSFTTDIYRQYLSQNINNITASTLLNVLSVGLSAGSTLNRIGIPDATSLSNSVSDVVSPSIKAFGGSMPDKLSGRTTNSLLIPLQQNGVTVLYETPTSDEAKQIDDYFQMYGYSCGKVKVPNLTHGLWSYVKCSEFEFVPDGISYNGMQAIKAMFEKGVRVWNYTGGGKSYDTGSFCNYNVDRQPGRVF